MTDTALGLETVEPVESAQPVPVSDEQLVAMLVERARSEGLQLTGQGGLLLQLTKRVLESALEGEITDHLGYEKHEAAGRGSGNSRNGGRAKTVLTDVGPVEVKVPRDTSGTFEPPIVKKRQRRLTGVDEMVLSLSAKGLTHGEISAHLAEVYGAEVSRQTVSTITITITITITDTVMEGMAEWQNRTPVLSLSRSKAQACAPDPTRLSCVDCGVSNALLPLAVSGAHGRNGCPAMRRPRKRLVCGRAPSRRP